MYYYVYVCVDNYIYKIYVYIKYIDIHIYTSYIYTDIRHAFVCFNFDDLGVGRLVSVSATIISLVPT